MLPGTSLFSTLRASKSAIGAMNVDSRKTISGNASNNACTDARRRAL
jgi:hypothetical protein